MQLKGMMKNQSSRLRFWLLPVWAVLIVLVFLSLRNIPLGDIFSVLVRLDGVQILALVAANAAILWLIAMRWRLVLSSLGWQVPLLTLLAYRLAGFGVNYFTPGPQVGGEPLQVYLLTNRRNIPLPVSISSIFLDRLVETLANFSFLAFGSLVIASSGLGGVWFQGWGWLPGVILLFIPAGHLAALWRGRQPVSWLTGQLWRRLKWPALKKINEVVVQSEGQVAHLCRDNPWSLVRVLLLSIVILIGMVGEFWLVLHFFDVPARFFEAISALTAARLAILMPVPGGIGVLEMSQAFAAQVLGWEPALGIALSLVIRARDLFLASVGLWIGGFSYRSTLFDLSDQQEGRMENANERDASGVSGPEKGTDPVGCSSGRDHSDNLDHGLDPFLSQYGDGR